MIFKKQLFKQTEHSSLKSSLLGRFATPKTYAGQIKLTPPLLWKGDAGQGRWVCANSFHVNGHHIETCDTPWDDSTLMTHVFWGPYAKQFHFLSDLRAVGGHQARLKARQLAKSWIASKESKKRIKDPVDVAIRAVNWLTHFDFFGETASDDDITLMTSEIIKDLLFLQKYPKRHIDPLRIIHVAQAFIYGATCVSTYPHLLRDGMALLHSSLQEQILSDGGHISRSPQILFDWTKTCLELKQHLAQLPQHFSEPLVTKLDRMTEALNVLLLNNTTLPAFSGGPLYNKTTLSDIATLISPQKRRKAPLTLSQSHFYKLKQGRTEVIMDGGVPIHSKYSAYAHAGPGAFELIYGKDKIITNCGTHAVDPNWQKFLKATAAHSTLTLNDRNAFEILPDGTIGQSPRQMPCHRTILQDGSALIEISHEGYASSYDTCHTRQIRCSADGKTIYGFDMLTSDTIRTAPLEYCIRFHLHPTIKESFAQNREHLYLRLPNGKGARFTCENAKIMIDDSIVMTNSSPRKTKQIVLEGRYSGGVEKTAWIIEFL